MHPSVSVIIPCYNADFYIREAVESVLWQQGDFDLIEILIVDDRSDDENTTTVLKELAITDKVHVLENTGQKGPGAARNTGIDHATGDWIAFLDADDILTEDSINVRLAASKRFPQCGWIGGDFRIWYGGETFETESFFRSRPMPKKLLHEAFQEKQPILLKHPVREFLLSGLTNTCASLIRKDLLTKISGFDPTLRMQQDYHLFLRLANISDFVFIPDVVMNYRQHGNNSTKNDIPVFEWRVIGLLKLLNNNAFEEFSRDIKYKIFGLYINLSYKYRIQGNRFSASNAAFRALKIRPLSPTSWRALAAAWLGERKT